MGLTLRVVGPTNVAGKCGKIPDELGQQSVHKLKIDQNDIFVVQKLAGATETCLT